MRLMTSCRRAVLLALLIVAEVCSAQQRIAPAAAASHLGEPATVCGVVASATYAQRTRGAPTFLNLDRPYPNQVFTAVIWGNRRSRFATPPESLRGQRVCVSGVIESYRGKPEIIVNQPSQITEPR